MEKAFFFLKSLAAQKELADLEVEHGWTWSGTSTSASRHLTIGELVSSDWFKGIGSWYVWPSYEKHMHKEACWLQIFDGPKHSHHLNTLKISRKAWQKIVWSVSDDDRLLIRRLELWREMTEWRELHTKLSNLSGKLASAKLSSCGD